MIKKITSTFLLFFITLKSISAQGVGELPPPGPCGEPGGCGDAPISDNIHILIFAGVIYAFWKIYYIRSKVLTK